LPFFQPHEYETPALTGARVNLKSAEKSHFEGDAVYIISNTNTSDIEGKAGIVFRHNILGQIHEEKIGQGQVSMAWMQPGTKGRRFLSLTNQEC